jgi:hypothetical protein
MVQKRLNQLRKYFKKTVQQKTYNFKRNSHTKITPQKVWHLIRISHQKNMQPSPINFKRTSLKGKKARNRLRKSHLKIRQQKAWGLIKKSHKGPKTMKSRQEISLRPKTRRPFSAYSITPPSPIRTLMHAVTSSPCHQPEPPTECSNH